MKKQFRFVIIGSLIVLLISGIALAGNFTFDEKAAVVNERVAAGELDRDLADELLAKMQTRMAECDGTGMGPDPDRVRLGQELGIEGFKWGQKGNGTMDGMGNKGANRQGTASGLGTANGAGAIQ